MNKKPAYGHGESPYCCFHPREVVVGVCAHCLKDRLLLLLAAAGDATQHHRSRGRGRSSRSGSISLPKVFALGSSFLQRLDSRHHRPEDDGDAAGGGGASGTSAGTTSGSAAASLDDSFISIKFEDNGKATWDSRSQNNNKQQDKAPAVRSSSSSTVVVAAAAEHAKRGRWRKQVVGRLLQLARWKSRSADGKKLQERSNSKTRRGWIRTTLTLTRRRAAADLHRPWSSSS